MNPGKLQLPAKTIALFKLSLTTEAKHPKHYYLRAVVSRAIPLLYYYRAHPMVVWVEITGNFEAPYLVECYLKGTYPLT